MPKYQMFPAGKLAATTCSSWCYIFDRGRGKYKNPISEVTKVVGTWTVPLKRWPACSGPILQVPMGHQRQVGQCRIPPRRRWMEIEAGRDAGFLRSPHRQHSVPASDAAKNVDRLEADGTRSDPRRSRKRHPFLKQASASVPFRKRMHAP